MCDLELHKTRGPACTAVARHRMNTFRPFKLPLYVQPEQVSLHDAVLAAALEASSFFAGEGEGADGGGAGAAADVAAAADRAAAVQARLAELDLDGIWLASEDAEAKIKWSQVG